MQYFPWNQSNQIKKQKERDERKQNMKQFNDLQKREKMLAAFKVCNVVNLLCDQEINFFQLSLLYIIMFKEELIERIGYR